MTQLAGYGAAIYAASQTSLTFSNEAMTDSGDHKTYAITNTIKRFWDRAVLVAVQESTDSGTSWHTAAAAYTLQNCGGKVIFATANNSAYLYRTSGNYLPITQIGNGHEWDIAIDSMNVKATVFGDAWQDLAQVLNSATVTIQRYWQDGYFVNNITAGTVFVVALYINQSLGSRFEAFAYATKTMTKTPEAGLVDTTISIDIDGQLYYYAA